MHPFQSNFDPSSLNDSRHKLEVPYSCRVLQFTTTAAWRLLRQQTLPFWIYWTNIVHAFFTLEDISIRINDKECSSGILLIRGVLMFWPLKATNKNLVESSINNRLRTSVHDWPWNAIFTFFIKKVQIRRFKLK